MVLIIVFKCFLYWMEYGPYLKSITFNLSDNGQIYKSDRSGSVIAESSRLNSSCCGNGSLYLHLIQHFDSMKMEKKKNPHNMCFKVMVQISVPT